MAAVHTQKLLHWDAFTNREAFTHKIFYTQQAFITTGIAAPRPDLDAKATKPRFWSTFLKGIWKTKIISAKIENLLTNHCRSLDAATPIRFTRSSCKRHYSITHAAAAPSNLDAATTIRSAETELQSTIELRATVSEIAAPKPDLDAKAEKRRFWSTL